MRWISLNVSPLLLWFMINGVRVAYVTDITNDIEHDSCKNVRGSSEQQSDVLVKAQ